MKPTDRNPVTETQQKGNLDRTCSYFLNSDLPFQGVEKNFKKPENGWSVGSIPIETVNLSLKNSYRSDLNFLFVDLNFLFVG